MMASSARVLQLLGRAGLLVVLFAALDVGLAPIAEAAAADEECPTWFPDFRCERSGRYEGFVAPISQPYFFEDPFITTSASLVGVWHQFPDNSAFDGGDAWVIALQLRVAITDRLAFIATKDGYTWFQPGDASAIGDTQGWNNLGFGVKYAVVDRPEDNFIVSSSFRFEVPSGQKSAFQAWGGGVFIPGLSMAWGRDKFHVIGDVGGQVPFDHSAQASQFFFHAHFDYALWKHFVPMVEFSGYYYTGDAKGEIPVPTTPLTLQQAQTALGTGPFDATDVANLGSQGISNTIISTMAVGARIPIMKGFSTGAVWEFPISGDKWLFEQRVTMNLMYEF
jgi:hypothetical protein